MATSLLFHHLQQAGLPELQQLQGLLCTPQPEDDAAHCRDSSTGRCCDSSNESSSGNTSSSWCSRSCCCSSYTRNRSCGPTDEVCICNNAGKSYPPTRNCSTNDLCCSSSSTSSAAVDNGAPGALSSSSSRNCNSHAECLAQRILSLSTPLVPPPPPYSIDKNGVLRSACSMGPNPCNSNCTSCRSSSAEAASEEGVPSSPRSIFSIDSVGLACATFVPSLYSVFRGLWEASCANNWLLSLECPATPRRVVAVEVWKLRPNTELSGQLKLWGNAALARGRAAAAAALYTAGMLLLPNDSNTTNCNGLLAVLCANASLALLRLGRLRLALRTATEAVAADPMYSKAWHRRATALVHLKETVERQFLPVCFSSSSTRSRGSSTGHNTESCTAAARACLQHIDREIADAQMMYQRQVDASEAEAAASRMTIGCCGCGCKAASLPSSEGNNDAVPHSPGFWLRGDVSAQLGTKGWGLVTANNALSRREDDPCLVLEEEAFAVYVHPNLCATVPKIPFSLASHTLGLQLHADAAVRDAWERLLEDGVSGKEGSEGNDESEKEEQPELGPEIQKAREGICAGCATVPARGEGASNANECHVQGSGTWHSSLSHLLYPTLPVVPCGSCAAALFCCHGCRAASSHKRACGLQQQQHLQQQVACGMEIRIRSSAAGESIPDTAVQALALSLPDPHRCIARQLLASVLPPAAAVAERAEEINSATTVKAPFPAAVDFGNAPNSAGLSMLKEPPWHQVLMRTSSVVVDRTRLADWLLNAAWLAGEAAASGRGLQCGGRCLICRSAGGKTSLPPHSALATATNSLSTAATGSAQPEIAARRMCGRCCICCKPWCPKCSLSPSAEQNSDGLQHCGAPFPRCLFAAALHVYGVASCNTFTIRVSCDPEEEAVAAGTALFLVASLLNHSCSPNAVAAFGEPKTQLQHQQQRHHNMLDQHQRDCAVAQPVYLLPSPHCIGRGALLQVRLCAQQNCEGSSHLQELCISYGPVVGLPRSSWGFRQDWLLRHAGFFCRCEACLPPSGGDTTADLGNVAFRPELLYGFPCPLCTSISCAGELLGGIQRDTISEQECRALFDTAALLKRCLGPHLKATSSPADLQRKHLTEQPTRCSIYSKMPGQTLEFIAALPRLLLHVLAKAQGQQRWTSTQILALLGHSCAPLWSPQAKAFPDCPAIIHSFLDKNTQLYAFSEFSCLNCSSTFAASALKREQEAVHAHLDGKLSALRKLVSPSSRVTGVHRGELLAVVLKDILKAIPQVVAVSGCLSTDVWQALQSAARAAHAQAHAMRQAHADRIGSVDSVSMAATCLSAGIYVLLQRLPLGLSQPEVCAQMYRAAMLFGQLGDRTQTKQILEAAINATLKSCGPHSVSRSCLKDCLRWLEGEEHAVT